MYGGFARAGAAVAVSSEADRSGRAGGRRCARHVRQYGWLQVMPTLIR